MQIPGSQWGRRTAGGDPSPAQGKGTTCHRKWTWAAASNHRSSSGIDSKRRMCERVSVWKRHEKVKEDTELVRLNCLRFIEHREASSVDLCALKVKGGYAMLARIVTSSLEWCYSGMGAVNCHHIVVQEKGQQLHVGSCLVDVYRRGRQARKRRLKRSAGDDYKLFKYGFLDHYRLELRGACAYGQYAAVVPAFDLHTGIKVAVKVISKAKIKNGASPGENVKVEVQALQKLQDKPNVVRFLDAYQDATFFYIVLEYLEGGTLLERVKAAGHLDEAVTGCILHQMLTIISICHKAGICHRDLKLENFLFKCPQQDDSLKLVDFGSAGFFKSGEHHPFQKTVGTLVYMAPEVVRGIPYGPPADVWCLGVTAYAMLCGLFPFPAPPDETKEAVPRKPLDFTSQQWDAVSASAKDLLAKMLHENSERRISASEALLHPWIQQHRPGRTSKTSQGPIPSCRQ